MEGALDQEWWAEDGEVGRLLGLEEEEEFQEEEAGHLRHRLETSRPLGLRVAEELQELPLELAWKRTDLPLKEG